MKQRRSRRAIIRKVAANPRRGVVIRLMHTNSTYEELRYGTPELKAYSVRLLSGEIGCIDSGFRFIES